MYISSQMANLQLMFIVFLLSGLFEVGLVALTVSCTTLSFSPYLSPFLFLFFSRLVKLARNANKLVAYMYDTFFFSFLCVFFFFRHLLELMRILSYKAPACWCRSTPTYKTLFHFNSQRVAPAVCYYSCCDYYYQ